MTIQEKQKELVEEFAAMEDWSERFHHIIDLGKELSPLEDKFYRDEYIVPGCTSKVWLYGEYKDNKLYFKADSDSILVKGLIAILIEVYSGFQKKDILESNTDFIKEIGITENLTANRANGLGAMLAIIRKYAEDEIS